MALTATATQGFEFYRSTAEQETIHVPGDPGVTYTRGDRVVMTVGEGVLTLAAANEGGIVGRVARTMTCPGATTAFPKPADFDPVDFADSQQSALVEIEIPVSAGKPVYLATFANQDDEDVAGYVSGTRIVTITNAPGGDDYYNGALVYVYEGPGIGECNVVEDTTNATPSITMHRPFETDLTTASKVIILAGEAAADRGTGVLGRCEGGSASALTVNQGADDGDYVILMDWREAAGHLSNLRVPVIDAKYLMAA